MNKALNGNWILTDDDSVQYFRELETTRER